MEVTVSREGMQILCVMFVIITILIKRYLQYAMNDWFLSFQLSIIITPFTFVMVAILIDVWRL